MANVTARRIAEFTGYSYSAIYHYFSDLNALLLETKLVMIRDMVRCGIERTTHGADPLQHIKEQAKFPIDYFTENPNIYIFFHTYKLDERNEQAMKSLELEKDYWDDYLPFLENCTIHSSDIPIISRTIMYSVYGMISLYLSGNGLPKEAVYQDLDNLIDYLLKGNKNDEITR